MNIYKTILSQVKADSFLISNIVNISYPQGFNATLGYLLLTPKKNYFITDSRYLEYAEKTVKDVKIYPLKGGIVNVLKSIIEKANVRSLAYEYAEVSHVFFNRVIKRISPGKLLPAKNTIKNLRMIKNESEIKKIEIASKIVLSSVEDIFRKCKKYHGLSEKDVADEIENLLRRKGATSSGFPLIVAEGSHSSQPHHHSSIDKKVKFSPLLIDAGAIYEDYNSDLTRTFANHTISKKFKTIFKIVEEAQERAFCAIKPGAKASEIDSAARNFIADAGYGEFFGHGLGHGIGLEVHEKPIISAKNDTVLKPGMVFTIEPGIYLPGKFGCRIEDIALVTDSGYKILTRN